MHSFAVWKPNKRCKSAVKISSRSELISPRLDCDARSSTKTTGRDPRKFRQSLHQGITLYNVWCDAKSLRFLIYEHACGTGSALRRCLFIGTYVALLPLLSSSFRRKSALAFHLAKETSKCIQSESARYCTLYYVLNFQNSALCRAGCRDKIE